MFTKYIIPILKKEHYLFFILSLWGHIVCNAQDRIEYWQNGNIKSKKSYKDGNEQGVSIYWYENGQIKELVTIKNGIEMGEYIAWYETGDKMAEGFRYDINDTLTVIDTVTNELVYKVVQKGNYTFWNKNGHKELEVKYSDDLTTSYTSYYDTSGTFIKRETFKNGAFIGIEIGIGK